MHRDYEHKSPLAAFLLSRGVQVPMGAIMAMWGLHFVGRGMGYIAVSSTNVDVPGLDLSKHMCTASTPSWNRRELCKKVCHYWLKNNRTDTDFASVSGAPASFDLVTSNQRPGDKGYTGYKGLQYSTAGQLQLY